MSAADKIKIWKNKLLDMGKRNRLLNYKTTQNSFIRIVKPGFEELFDVLVIQNKSLQFCAKDSEGAQSVLSDESDKELLKSLYMLRSKAKTSLEEQGINVLYLAFGFLQWEEEYNSKEKLLSPLVLVPVELISDSITDLYTISSAGDDIVVNPVLMQKLQVDFGITLPEIQEEENMNIALYLDSVRALASVKGWDVKYDVHLSLFSFLKLSMYKDLENNTEKISNHPLIKAICGDLNDSINVNNSLISGDDSDNKVDAIYSYQVWDADSSQKEAIEAARKGVSFVLQGPPGTGKSQTIANIILECLADDRKVLFVSEKMAALDIVYNRLKDIGLEDFCLELHSHKANKKNVISELGRTLNQDKTKVKDDIIEKLDTLLIDRERLNEYSKSLHTVCYPLGKTPYQIHGEVVKYSNEPELNFEFEGAGETTSEDIKKYTKLLEHFTHAAGKMGSDYKCNPWFNCTFPVFSVEVQQDIIVHFGTIKEELSKLINLINFTKDNLFIENISTINKVEWLLELLSFLTAEPKPSREWLVFDESKKQRDKTLPYDKALANYEAIKAEIASKYNEEIYHFDSQGCLNGLSESLPKALALFKKRYIKTENDLLKKRDEITNLINKTGSFAEELLLNSEELYKILRINTGETLDDILKLLNIASLISEDPKPKEQWLKGNNIVIVKKMAEDARALHTKLDTAKKDLLDVFDTDIFNIDLKNYILLFRLEYSSLFKYTKQEYYKNRRSIMQLVKNGNDKLKDRDLLRYLETAKEILEMQQSIQVKQNKWKYYLGDWYEHEHTRWEELFKSIEVIEKIQNKFNPLEINDDIKAIILESGDKVADIRAKFKALQHRYNNSQKIYSNITDKITFITKAKGQLDDNLSINLKDCRALADNASLILSTVYADADKIASICKNNSKPSFDEITADLKKVYFINNISETVNWTGSLLKHFSGVKLSEGFVNKVCSSDTINKLAAELQEKLLISMGNLNMEIKYVDSIFEVGTHNLKEKNIEEINNWVEACLNNLSLLIDWIDFRTSKESCIKNGLGSFIEEVIKEQVERSEIVNTFFKKFYSLWLDSMYNNLPGIQNFKNQTHDKYIKKFKDFDKLQMRIAQSRIKEILSAKRPDMNSVVEGSELALLHKEVEKRVKNLPIRKLFQEIPNLLLTLKPCLLMSPLSVSLYLDSDLFKFDVVIFDEASQISSEDAIGAIYRSNQVIVAGDREQLSPTNFFAASTGEKQLSDESEEDTESAESILDECGNVLDRLSLRWHYRSRHENLINFSNAKIYKNLITSPSAKEGEDDFGVQFIPVKDGIYDRSGSRTNIIEAKKVGELVFEHFKKHPERSLGVIALSQAQQAAIDSEIRSMRIKNKKFEAFFSDDKKEAFFIKNLENVQGDERDTIIFSVGYAKDNKGVLHMNFGPLTRQGGYKRLNVAITRAKYNIKLVSSLEAKDIDLKRTSSEGVKMLKQYIEFALDGSGDVLREISADKNSGEAAKDK